MDRRGSRSAGAFAAFLALVAAAPAAAQERASAQAADARYALAGGCYELRSQQTGRAVMADAGPFRMQATALGRYLLYGKARDFLATDGEAVEMAPEPSASAEWIVEAADGAFSLTSRSERRALGVSESGVPRLAREPGAATRFDFVRAEGCAVYPEVEVNATGEPSRGEAPWSQVRGMVDAHMHMMAFEFLGGRAHCGRPWHPYGAPYALTDCPDHYPANGAGAVLENVLYGNPARTHDPVGWPTFRDWPHPESLTHEQSYYKWLERAWRGGLRVFVNLLVENRVLCEIYPYKQNSCNEMGSVRLQARRIRQLEDYIDAQAGGPGRGWFRIVTSPSEARRVINDGKLAVVLGIEISELFHCTNRQDVPQCTEDDIDRRLAEAWDMGVRDMEFVNKFDNALGGVAFDSGAFGAAINAGQFYASGRFWQLQHCDEEHDHDNPQPTGHESVESIGLAALLPPGGAPVYPAPPHCNTRGLSPLGEHLVRRMIERGMIIDPDHLSVLARSQLLNVVEAENYGGIVSSHSWSTRDAYRRILARRGFVAPYAGSSTGFVEHWRENRELAPGGRLEGMGWGADMNGFGSQGGPRPDNEQNPVQYPFRSFDGAVTLDRQRSGERVFDINVDGVAHYGLYPDWVEDLRRIAGDEIVEDLARGGEAYLKMWERASGVPTGCRSERGTLSRRGLGRVRLGADSEALLRAAGQPDERGARVWRWCVDGRGDDEVLAVLTPQGRVALVVSTARGHRAAGLGPGAAAERLPDDTRRVGRGVHALPLGRGGASALYGVRRGRVGYAAVASRRLAASPARLRAYLRLAGVR